MLAREHAGNEVYRVERVETKDYLQWECRGGKAESGHMTLLTARTATQVSPKTHLLAIQAALQRSGPATRAALFSRLHY